MSEKPKNAFEQVMAARYLTSTYGALHGLQVDQILVWGYLAFQHLKFGELEAAADMERKVIHYQLKTKRKPKANLKRMIQMLRDNLHVLLGPEWDLVVLQGRKTIFGESRTVEQKKNESRRATARTEPGSGEAE